MDGFVKGDASSPSPPRKDHGGPGFLLIDARMTGRTPINQQRDKRPGDTARWRTGGAHARADTENRLPIYRNRVPGKWSITKKREVCLPFFFLYYYYFFFLRNDSIHADLLLLSRFCRLSYRSFLLVDLSLLDITVRVIGVANYGAKHVSPK